MTSPQHATDADARAQQPPLIAADDAAKSSRFTVTRVRLFVVLAIGTTMAILVLCHVHGVNGPWYWTWAWRRLNWSIYPILAAASSPLFIALGLHGRGVQPRRLLALLMAGALFLQLGALLPQPL